MSYPQHITTDVGGTIRLELPSPATEATCQIFDDRGNTAVSSAAATVSSVSTTLSAALSIGDTSATVASAVGITEGMKLLLGGPDERVVVETISGTTVTLKYPVLSSHASGQSVESTLVSYTVAAADANNTFYDGHAKFVIDPDNDGDVYIVPVDFTKYPVRNLATAIDIHEAIPEFLQYYDQSTPIADLLETGFQDTLTRVGAKGRMYATLVGEELKRASALKAAHVYFSRHDNTSEMADRYFDQWSNELENIISILPRDTDNDGLIEEHEKISLMTIPLYRSS